MGPGSRPGRRTSIEPAKYLPRAIFPWHDRTIRKQQGIRMRKFRLVIFICSLIATTPSHAARCGGDFNTFVQNISADAASAGISQGVIASALGGVTQDPAVLSFDRRQRYTFNK